VTLSSQSLQSQQAQLSAGGSNSSADWKQIVGYLKQQFESLKDEIRQDFFKNNGLGANSAQSASTTAASQTSSADGIPGLPITGAPKTRHSASWILQRLFSARSRAADQIFFPQLRMQSKKDFPKLLHHGKLPDAVSKL